MRRTRFPRRPKRAKRAPLSPSLVCALADAHRQNEKLESSIEHLTTKAAQLQFHVTRAQGRDRARNQVTDELRTLCGNPGPVAERLYELLVRSGEEMPPRVSVKVGAL